MKEMIKAYLDLTRLHFWFVWPTLFCSGLVLAFARYSDFSWELLLKAAFIGFFGFEAGFVLNDYVDRNIDTKDVDSTLTRYWRPFNERPLVSGVIPPQNAVILFIGLVAAAAGLALTLPFPHNVYLLGAGVYCYTLEYFYQVKKRDQTMPIAQLVGRTDFVLFPVAGYLVYGHVDTTALLYFIFFYPFALAHLGVNDMIDIKNDKIRKLKTVPVLYGLKGTAKWILFFIVIHFVVMPFFLLEVGVSAAPAFAAAFLLLLIATRYIIKEKTSHAALKVLPLFHVSMLLYAGSIILVYLIYLK
ncbi:MAG: UbiA family prenyltransferase [Candidatus Methanofastidiosia archaeon]|jgi:4-hydroxybenzoate polyprenyltransferase